MTSAAVPHFFNASGAKKMDLHLGQGTTDKPLPTPMGDCHFIENGNANLTMWFETSHVSSLDVPPRGSSSLDSHVVARSCTRVLCVCNSMPS